MAKGMAASETAPLLMNRRRDEYVVIWFPQVAILRSWQTPTQFCGASIFPQPMHCQAFTYSLNEISFAFAMLLPLGFVWCQVF
jgi:hypothetical protein